MIESIASILKEHQELKLVRRRLLKYCSPVTLGNLTMDTLSLLAPYIHPMTVEELRGHLQKDRMLWYYMFTPDADLLDLEDARNKAAKTLISALDSGKLDKEEVAGHKLALEAAKDILTRTEIKYEGKSQLDPEQLRKLLPRRLQGKSLEELKEMKAARLSRH